jgi:EAL domain-containing protein (putative c-di-GMP-specific phosphodiesterase class I)/DNA-binding NarL/FixJ family response regulator
MSKPNLTLRVLAVDDEPFQLKLLTRQLRNLGIQDVRTCVRADEALALVQSDAGGFDVICCDLQMPQMDGVEFVRHLAEASYIGGLVLISGEDDRVLRTAERLAKAHSLRVLGALHKPVSADQLLETMTAVSSSAPPSLPRGTLRRYAPVAVGQAIERGELVNHYQPQVELGTGRVTGVEALVRWQHPQDGLVYPDQFVGVAEEYGLIDNLTRCVLSGLHGALQQARDWQDAGLPLQVSVNVSMDNLTDHGFPAFVADEVARAGVPPSRLTLEVTESRLMKDPLVTLDILTRMRLKRIGLSIDDFGTGHSSLSQLRDIPFDELKIDRSFVHGAARREAQRTILRSSIDMARQLGLKTVAEGVEDLEDWTYLRSTGCDLAQGYFIARPMPAEAIAAWIAEWELRFPSLLLPG